MKKLLVVVVILLLIFGFTVNSLHIEEEFQDEDINDYYEDYHDYIYGTEAETTADITVPTETEEIDETLSSDDVITEELTEESATRSNNTAKKTESKPSHSEKPVVVRPEQTRRPVSKTTKTYVTTTKRAVTTTRQVVTTTRPVVTTTKVQTTAAPAKKPPAYTPQSDLVTLLNTINSYRAQNGVGKLSLDSELCRLAYIRAQEQDALRGHSRPDNSHFYSVLEEYNYDYYGCGENLAFLNNTTVPTAFDCWKNSTSHNKNMLDSRWTKAGIAMDKNADGSYSIALLLAC